MPRKSHPGKDITSGMGKALLNKKKNAQWKKQASTQYAGVHVSDAAVDGGAGRLQSVTDRHELDEFLCDALLKESEFEVQHSSTVILTSEAVTKQRPEGDHALFEYEDIPIPRRPHWDEDTTHEMLDRAERETFMAWRRDLAIMEESLPEGSQRTLTPFEKNLEVWKQLWRVLERSHVAVQILDARNPLLFRCKDIEKYVRELSAQQGTHKTCLLVINKADYLTPRARRFWADYLRANDIDFVFWSAALEQARLDDVARAKRRQKSQLHNYHGHNVDRVDEGRIKGASSSDDEEQDAAAPAPAAGSRRRAVKPTYAKPAPRAKQPSKQAHREREDLGDDVLYEDDLGADVDQHAGQHDVDDEDDEEDDKKKTLKASTLWEEQAVPAAASASAASAAGASTAAASAAAASSSSSVVHKILTRDQLFDYIVAKYCNSSPENKARYESGERLIVGMCGYPNVGKSSTINVLAGSKKVVVSATPGKTKHFQTINVPDSQITLCDCPGLVSPTFLSSRAELVCNGIMPIDQIKDWKNIWAPVQLICEKVSRAQLQQVYSLLFPAYKELNADDLLNAYARMRSFYKDHGRPDEAHAARIILKDFCSGKLLYAHPPPNLTLGQRGEFYGSFAVDGENLINESLYLSPDEIKARKDKQLEDSVKGLALTEAEQAAAAAAEQAGGIVNTRRIAGAASSALQPTQRKAAKAAAAAAAKRAKQSQAIREAKDEDNEEEEDEDEEDDEDEDSEDDEEDEQGAAAAAFADPALPGRRARATVNQAVLDAQLRDDLSDLVSPSSAGGQQNREAAKLQAAGFNPDGTPLSKKQLQRLSQRNKKQTGKAFKLRKHQVPMEEVGYKIGGKSSDSAARLGVFHG